MKLQLVFVMAVTCFSQIRGQAQAQHDHPLNIIIVNICSLRADHMGLYGYPKPTTPNLDMLGKDMFVFDRAVAQSSWCLPNDASLFTGQIPEVHGKYSNRPNGGFPAFEIPLAERLKKAGYATGAFTGGIYFLPVWGLQQGFDTNINQFSTETKLASPLAPLVPEIRNWVNANRKKPFFLFASVDNLHTPYQSDSLELFDAEYSGIVHDADTISVQFYRAYNGEAPGPAGPLKSKLELFRSDPRNLVHLAAHYDAALAGVDREVSGLVNWLKQAGLWEHSVVIIAGHHGELLGEHGLLGHTQSLYEPITHVPLMIHHPRYQHASGTRIGELVQEIDIFPTILDSIGLSYSNDEIQGKSLIPLLKDPSANIRAFAFSSSKRNLRLQTNQDIDERTIRDERWKLHWYQYKRQFELYNLDNDPLEKQDVSGQYPEEVNRLAFELANQVERTRPHTQGLPSGRQLPLEPYPLLPPDQELH